MTCRRARIVLRKPSLRRSSLRFALGDESARARVRASYCRSPPRGSPTGSAEDRADRPGLSLIFGSSAVRRVLELGVALAHFQHFRLEKRARIERLAIALSRIRRTAAASPQIRRASSSDVRTVTSLLASSMHCDTAAHAAADVEPEVPRHADEALDARVQLRVARAGGLVIRQQHQDVDVGIAEPVRRDRIRRRRRAPAVGRQCRRCPRRR